MDNLRHFTRVQINLGAEIMYTQKAFQIQVKDISLGGAYLASTLPLRIDEMVELRIFLNSPEHQIEVEGRVAWLKGDGTGFGLEFNHLKPIDIWALSRQIQIDPKDAFQMPQDKKKK